MSLEEALAENTAALKAHTAALSGIAAAAKGATAGKTASAGAAAGGKPAGTAAKPGTSKPKAPTIEDIRAKFGGYLSTKDKELRAVRMEQVGAINAHFGVAKATDLPPELFAEALGYLKAYEDGGEPEFVQAEEGGDDGDEGEGESLV